MEPLLQVLNLDVGFHSGTTRRNAASQVSFQIYPGEVLALVGESGAGKSVTALSLLRLLPKNGYATGDVLYHGQNLLTMSDSELDRIRGAEISMIFQDIMNSLNPVFTIGRQIAEPMRTHLGLSKEQAFSRTISLLEKTGIRNARQVAFQFPHQLSGGMRQRAMIAMALACNPRLLIADEPTTALDVTIQLQIMRLLRQLRTEMNMALLLITHDLGIVAETADRILVMYAGQCIESGTAEAVLTQPLHPYTQALVRAVPPIRGAASQRLYAIPGSVPETYDTLDGCRFRARCPYAPDCTSALHDPGMLELAPQHLSRCPYLAGGNRHD